MSAVHWSTQSAGLGGREGGGMEGGREGRNGRKGGMEGGKGREGKEHRTVCLSNAMSTPVTHHELFQRRGESTVERVRYGRQRLPGELLLKSVNETMM